MNHYPRHVGDFIKDTVGLSLAERGAYTALLDQYYSSERPIAYAERYRITGAVSKADKAAVDYVMGRYFTEAPDGWHQKRADEEIALYRDRVADAKRAINTRWERERKTKYETDTGVLRPNAERNTNQEPVTNNHKPEGQKQRARAAPVALPVWLPPNDWQRWARHRGNKLTPQAIALQINKLDALRGQGFDVSALIDAAIEGGWATFYPPRSSAQGGNKHSERQRVAAEIFGGAANERPNERVIDGEAERVA